MLVWEYWYCYFLLRYIAWGQKDSAHFFAMCVMSFLLGCNILAILFFILPAAYLDSKSFKTVIIVMFGILVSLNSLLFLAKQRYIKLLSVYQSAGKGEIVRMKYYLWIYIVATACLLVLSFSM